MDNVLDLEVQFNGLQMGDTFLVDLDLIGTPFRGPPGRDGTNGTDGAPGADGEDGTNGTDGREVELRLDAGWVQWRYVNDPDWIDIISVASLVGPEGPAGTDGNDGTDGLNGTDGEDGRSVELQLSATHIQWRLVGNIPWLDLVPLASITGPAGADGNDGNDGREVQLRSDSGWIQWRYVGDVAWTNLVSEASLTGPAGADGTDGTDGADGADGPAIELNVSATHIQWRVVGSPTWIDLIALSALIGPEGPAGADGADGADGVGSSAIEVIAVTSYNLLAADVNKYLLFTAATPKTLTVRPDATEALPVNGEWHVRNRGAGNITLTAGAGVTLNIPTGGNLIVPTGGTVTLKRTAINVFDVIGVTQAATALGDAAFKNTGTTAGTVAAGDDARLLNNYRITGGTQEILNHTKTLFNSTGSSMLGVLPPAYAGDWVTNYRDGAAGLINTISSGNQAGFRAIAFSGLTNNRFIRIGGTAAAPTNIASNDVIGDLNFWGRIAGADTELCRMRASYVDADPSLSNNKATQYSLSVGRNGSTGTAEIFRALWQSISVRGTLSPLLDDNTHDLGTAAFRWREIFSANNVINTSDERLKRDIQPITDELLDAWANVQWSAYRWIDAYEEKGQAARWHFGLIAQRVRDVIDAHFGEGIAIRMGIICYDEWEAKPEVTAPIMAEHVVKVQKYDDKGIIIIGEFSEELQLYDTGEVEVVQPATEAGSRWGLRYGECQAIENAYQRREDARQAEEIALLREEIARLKELIQ